MRWWYRYEWYRRLMSGTWVRFFDAEGRGPYWIPAYKKPPKWARNAREVWYA
jgi:hypothetical protein